MSEQNSIISVDAISLGSMGVHLIFDEINEFTAKQACEWIIKSNLIYSKNEQLTMFINSPGGNVTDGLAIIDMMEASRLKVSTRAIGQIASMGVTIFVCGSKGLRYASPNTCVMTHQFSGMIYGKEHELLAVRNFHDSLSEKFVEIFTKKTKMSKKQVKDVLFGPSDKYLNAKDCLKYGICDKICNPFEFEQRKVVKPKSGEKKSNSQVLLESSSAGGSKKKADKKKVKHESMPAPSALLRLQ